MYKGHDLLPSPWTSLAYTACLPLHATACFAPLLSHQSPAHSATLWAHLIGFPIACLPACAHHCGSAYEVCTGPQCAIHPAANLVHVHVPAQYHNAFRMLGSLHIEHALEAEAQPQPDGPQYTPSSLSPFKPSALKHSTHHRKGSSLLPPSPHIPSPRPSWLFNTQLISLNKPSSSEGFSEGGCKQRLRS